MSDRTEIDRLCDCLEAVHHASRRLIGYVDAGKRAAFLAALGKLAEAWKHLEPTLREADRADQADHTASLLAGLGEDAFYDFGAANEAIATFELALSMSPRHVPSLKGIIAAYLQGDERRPAHALPFAERLAAIDPGHERSVRYIRSLMVGG